MLNRLEQGFLSEKKRKYLEIAGFAGSIITAGVGVGVNLDNSVRQEDKICL